MTITNKHRAIDKIIATAVCVAMLSLPALRASAQAAPPTDYRVTWTTCTDTTQSTTGDETVSGTFTYTVPTTGEYFQVDLLMINTATRTSLSADYYDASGNLAASVSMVNGDGSYSLTEYGSRLSADAGRSYVEVLTTYELQRYLLQDCLAAKCKPWVAKLIKGLCILAAGICCAVSTVGCPLCAGAAVACSEIADEACK